jgi:hypothetical protein
MARTKYLAVGMAALVLVATAAAPAAFAQRGSDNTTTEVAETTSTTNSSDPTETETETADAKEQAAKVESKRTEIRARLDALKEDRETKLDEKRLATCETKSAKINSIIQKRSAQATTQLAVFKKIADRVEKFISDKQLTIENYDTLAANINDKEAAATAAIEANTNTVFDCASADGSAPGKVAKASVQTVRDALKEYRTAIKDLIVKVKSNSALKTTDSTTLTNDATTTENTTTTGGNQ